MNSTLVTLIVAALTFFAVFGIGFSLTSDRADAARKRARELRVGPRTRSSKSGGKAAADLARRRAKTQDMLESLRRQDRERRKNRAVQDIGAKLTQAGLDMPIPIFWVLSVLAGSLCAGLAWISGADGLVINGISLKSRPMICGAAFFVGTFGCPQFVLNAMIKSRHRKLLNQFADGIDVIVRGIKTGLPLGECIRIVGKESPEPLRKEFLSFADNMVMGSGLERALAALYKRIPLQEVNYFSIVLLIQAKTGGNLSEALGNLSAVIRSRKMMREKVKALSSEARATAYIIGSLPFAAGALFFLAVPDYILELFRPETGHVIVAMAAALMCTGVMVMRKMVNFDI